jgi:hypothetical protein
MLGMPFRNRTSLATKGSANPINPPYHQPSIKRAPTPILSASGIIFSNAAI